MSSKLDYKILGQLIFDSSYSNGNGYGYGYGYGYGATADFEGLTPAVLYTVPANRSCTVTSVFITNHSAIKSYYDFAVVPVGEELALKHHIRWDQPVDGNDIDTIDIKLTLNAGDKLVVLPSRVDRIGFTAFGVEKYDI